MFCDLSDLGFEFEIEKNTRLSLNSGYIDIYREREEPEKKRKSECYD